MWRLVLALALRQLLHANQRAPTSLQADPRLLEACIANTDHAALEGCRGVVARACIEAEGGGSFTDVLCWSAEADAWRARIDASMQRMNAEHLVPRRQRVSRRRIKLGKPGPTRSASTGPGKRAVAAASNTSACNALHLSPPTVRSV